MKVFRIILLAGLCAAAAQASAAGEEFVYQNFKYAVCTGNGSFSDKMREQILTVIRSGNKLKDDCRSETMAAAIVRRSGSDPEFLRQLLALGLDPDYLGSSRVSGRMAALNRSELKAVEPLLTGSIDWKQTGMAGDNLLLMAFGGKVRQEIQMKLLENDIPAETVNARGSDGNSLLLRIAMDRVRVKDEVVQRLAALGADFNQLSSRGLPVIQELFVSRGDARFDEKQLKLFTSLGADVNRKNASGEGPLHFLSHYSTSHKLLQFVLDNRPDLELRDSRGNTPLLAVFVNHADAVSDTDRDYVVKKLIEQGADVNAVNKEGLSVLMAALMDAAARQKNDLAIAELLNAGARADVRSPTGRPALYYATLISLDFKAREAILAASTDLNERDPRTGATPLLLALLAGNTAMADQLVKAGADPNLADNEGRTPLMALVRKSLEQTLAQRLIKAGADVSARDKSGKGVLDHLEESEYAGEERYAGRLSEFRAFLIKAQENAGAGEDR